MSYHMSVPYLNDRTSREYAGISEQNLSKCILIVRSCNAEMICDLDLCGKKQITLLNEISVLWLIARSLLSK